MRIFIFASCYNYIRFSIFFMLLAISPAYANPVLSNIVAGSVQINQETNYTTINQTSPKAIIDWKGFDIKKDEKTHFQQPEKGITLNKINSNQMSEINGQLSATSKIILVNGAGIHFGPDAKVNVGGLIASVTSGVSDQKFMQGKSVQGKYIFNQPLQNNMGLIINEGSIKASDYGLVVLVGDSVINKGVIEANLGLVTLAAAKQFVINIPKSKSGFADELIYFAIDDAPIPKDGYIENTGKIIADGGKVKITASTASTVLDNIINVNGIIQANAVEKKHDGVIELYVKTPNYTFSASELNNKETPNHATL